MVIVSFGIFYGSGTSFTEEEKRMDLRESDILIDSLNMANNVV